MVEASEVASEERTEPFSQSELDARIKGIRVGEPERDISADEAVPLDVLRVEEHHHKQGIRILVRPLTRLPGVRSVSPGSDNCRWLALRAEVASSEQPEHQVLAVTQTSKDIKFSVRIPGEYQDREAARPPLWCELYYDPASDKIIFLNKSDVPILLSRASQVRPTSSFIGGRLGAATSCHEEVREGRAVSDAADSRQTTSPPSSPQLSDAHIINPGLAKALKPGTWRINVKDIAVLDFRVLEKRPVTLYQVQQPSKSIDSESSVCWSPNSSGKRLMTPDEDEKRVKRRISESDKEDEGVIMFLRPTAEPLVFPIPSARTSKELSAVHGHALLDTELGDTILVPGVCEVDEYQLTKREPIASTALSAVYKASHSNVPDNIVTVKVLKTRVSNTNDKTLAHERNVIRQADMWLRECQSQEDLRHDSIVRFYGGDARFLSLYMEHVQAADLASTRWRNKSDEFVGNREDAWRILRDIVNALNYIHTRKLVHNDIKPGNILYSPERGAVLCDFGLTSHASSSATTGGTPYYIAPEFIGKKLRGAPSDVWALGVTMLYVLRKFPFPERRARRLHHPKPLYWQIAGIHNPSMAHKQYGNGQPAANQMRDWLTEVFEVRERLDASRDRLERLVKEMLAPNPNQRITMVKILQEMGV